MLTAKQPAGIASQARTLTSPHFIFRVAKEATQKKFGRVWQPVSALKMPTFLKEKLLALQGHVKARWPCSELPRVKRVQVHQAAEEEEEAAGHDSDMSVDSYPLE